MKKKLTIIIILIIAALIISGCGTDKNTSTQTEKKPEKVLKVGLEPTFAPFEYQDEKSKEYVGFDIDLIKAVAKQMGYTVQINSMGFDGLIPALLSNNIDVSISGITITPERAEKVSFSAPYYKSGLSIVTKSNNDKIKSSKDLEGKKIAVQIGTSSGMYAKKVPNATVREFNLISDLFLELKNNGVDVVINDLPVNQHYLKAANNQEFKMLDEVLSAEEYGIAVNKNNPELHKKIDTALAELKKNGEYQKIYEKWFGKQIK